MKFLKRAAALLMSACTMLTCASCGENTATAMTVDGFDIRAGIYLYYVTTAYNDAIGVLRDGGETFEGVEETKDYKKILDKANIDEITAEEWIKNKAEDYCVTFVAIERDFERLGLSLSGEQLAAINNSVSSSMVYYGDFFTKTGIGEQSIKDIVANSYKQQALWEAYYGADGSVGVDEQTLYDHYADNHLRMKWIEMPLTDGEGNMLKSDGKAEIEKMAEDYMSRLKKKSGDEAALMKEFDFLADEHANYVTSLSEAAVTTTDDEGNQITTPTTPKLTTDKNGSTGETTTAPDETSTETTETTTNTTDETETGTTETTTVPAETTTETTETTETTTTTVSGLGYDTVKERVLAVSTTAKEDDDSTETTTAPTYTPCEKVYNWAVDPDTKYLTPEFIKDDEKYYIAIKMDIRDRMTDDDLWGSSNIENVRHEVYYDEFLDMLQEKADALPVERNEKAFRRYKVLDVDIVGYQDALYQSYASMYGMGG